MENQAILEQLLKLLEENRVTIRPEATGPGGGLCKLRGKTLFFYDKEASAAETAVLAAKAVGQTISDLDAIYLKPAVRDFIDKYVDIE